MTDKQTECQCVCVCVCACVCVFTFMHQLVANAKITVCDVTVECLCVKYLRDVHQFVWRL